MISRLLPGIQSAILAPDIHWGQVMQISISNVIGLAGVHNDENPRARYIGKLFEWPMLLVAALTVMAWYAESQPGADSSDGVVTPIDWLIWGFFLIETLVLLWLVEDRRRYVQGNWCNLLILAGGFLLFLDVPHTGGLRVLRLLAILAMLMNMSVSYRRLMESHNLGSTLVICFFILLVSGTLMALIDPNIGTPLDGLWWAWVTVTTVGYGDIVPVSTAGRVFASVLILMGIGLVSVLTATISALFIQQDEEAQNQRLLEQEERIEALEDQLRRMEDKLDRVLEAVKQR